MLGLGVAWNRVISVLLPARCVGCGVRDTYLCDRCLHDAPWLKPPLCPGCGAPGTGSLCSRCRSRPLALNGVTAPLAMAGVARQAVHQLKYRNLRALAPALGAIMTDAMMAASGMAASGTADALVPIPLHPRRLRERGYNQAALLAKEVSRLAGVPVWEGALQRHSFGQPQVAVADRETRWANVADAFRCSQGLEGTSLVLVDDVMTTGSTLHSAATALKAAGAASVRGLVLAREM